MNLLVIASNPLVLRMARSVLGHTVSHLRECCSLAEAVACYGSFHPDLVLTDSSLTDGDGAQVTSALRNAHPEAHVVVLADYDNMEMRAAALAAGAERYMLKEDMLKLVRLIQSLSEQGDRQSLDY